MRAHEEMMGAGQIAQWSDSMGMLIFTSHQWTSYAHLDHTGVQFRVLTSLMAASVLTKLVGQATGLNHHEEDERTKELSMAPARTAQSFDVDLGRVFVWLDYWSIPQNSKTCKDAAIRSIPAYASSAVIMLVLAPPVDHADTGEPLGVTTYRARGWCRAEEWIFGLSDVVGSAAPRVYLCEEAGVPPSKMANVPTSHRLRDPNSSVLRGGFTCCQRNHVDSHGKGIVCDKIMMLELLETVEEKVASGLLDHGDLPGWRRLLTTRWARMCEEPTHQPADHFLAALRIDNKFEKLEGNMYPLHYAVYANNTRAIAELLKSGADLYCRDGDGNSPLILAGTSDSSLAVKELLEAGADINDRNKLGCTPLMAATVSPAKQSMKILLASGADFSIPFSNTCVVAAIRGMTPLHFAAFYGHEFAVDLLLDANADAAARVPEECESAGCTALEIARRRGHAQVIAALSAAESQVFCV
ncbi:unnamed protein product [Prorocentrum cordatum]|uniref:Uncharacterized protein n=1 Tax=Prorocentrum cordatum TaxID=2364126 RepID=A0ABN9R0J3_9DINO|nr:unnamed protein product [Polarella glacialis]